MTERHDDPYVTDPFLARINLPSVEERDPLAHRPMVWPIASPRVRKICSEQLEDLADHHFLAKVFASILGGAVFLLGGLAMFLLLRYLLPWEIQGYLFGGAFTVLFVALVFVADRYRPPTPREVYYAAHTGDTVAQAGGGAPGRVVRVLLFGPYLVSVALRKILEPPPPADEAALDVALRLLPVLHEPLPLHRAELAGIAGREQIRRAALLLHALHLADLVLGPGNVVLLTPRTACAQLLREEGVAAPSDEVDDPGKEIDPREEIDPDLVATADIDTMELVAQAEELGLQPSDTLTSEWLTGDEDPDDGDPEP